MNKEHTIGAIVRENFNTSVVFAELGIDFCCGGSATLAESCQRKNLDVDEVIARLKQVSLPSPDKHFDNLSARSLIQQIMQIHHKYIVTTAPTIQLFLKKLVSRHGDHHPELREVDKLFDEAVAHLKEHMEQEEMILFPYVEAMEEALNNHFSMAPPHFGHVNDPIRSMETDHEAEGQRFRHMAKLTNNYEIPTDGCETYIVTFGLLQEFEKDLHTHIHLENNILFPKAKKLFAQLHENQ